MGTMSPFIAVMLAALVVISEGNTEQAPQPQPMLATRVEHRAIQGRASQGLALTEEYYFTANAGNICRFDVDWNLLEQKAMRLPGVNHLGAIDYHEGYIWGGFLNGPDSEGNYDPEKNQSLIAKIRARDLRVVGMWDITDDVTWIDPVCFDGEHLWVGDLSDLGIHRYHFTKDGSLVRDGILRYPKELHFSQGIRVVGNKLYSIHCFDTMKGLFEFEIPEELIEEINYPTRTWNVETTGLHLEGFDFVPGHPNQIWEAQFGHVDCWELEGLAAAN